MILALFLAVLSSHTVPDIKIRCRGEEKPLMAVLEDNPALLTFVFARCAGMCSLLIQSVNRAIESTGGINGYTVLVLSFDPRDTARDIEKYKERHHLSSESSWSFCVAATNDIERITRTVGFSYTWDKESMQFDHPAMVAALDKGGRIIRTIDGLPIDPSEFKSLVREMRGEFVPVYPLAEKTLLRCIGFDQEKSSVHLNWGFAVLFLPSVFSLLLTFLMFSRSRGACE